MVCRANFSLKGFEEYLELIAKAGHDVDAAADQANIAGGDVLLDGMLRRVPRKTGNLAEHLERTEPKVDGNFHYIEVGMPRKTDAETARYGNVQEYGSAHTPAQPYIRPAFDEDKAKARKAQREKLKKAGVL
jgi:HK97 gp10 family phage protein